MRIALDTNILVYAEGANDIARKLKIRRVLGDLSRADVQVMIPVQVIGELYNVLARKFRKTPSEARRSVLMWEDGYTFIDIRTETTLSAIDLSADHALSIWDAVILVASAQAGCRMLLSEDMQDGFIWAGLTVVNPFAEPLNPLLADYLRN